MAYASAMNARSGRFPYFDSLRAIAALSVLATHAVVFAGSSSLLPYGARLESGVAVFFLISGFLLYRPFARARLFDERPPRTGAYLWRRALRIAPAYWVALTVTALVLSTPGVFGLEDGPLYYFFAQTWRETTIGGGLTQAWTLCIEVTFYLFLPVWARALSALPGGDFAARLRTELIALGALFAASITWKVALLSGADPHQIRITPALEALPSFLDQFAIGMALAVVSIWVERRGALPRPLRAVERLPIGCWLVSAVAFWIAAKHIGLSGRVLEPFTPAQYLERHLLYAVIALGLVLPAVVGGERQGLVRRVLGAPVLAWLGLISYSIYLYSAPVLQELEHLGVTPPSWPHPFLGWTVLGIVVTVPVAAMSYYLVERPALSLKRFVPDRGTIRRGDAIAEPAPATVPLPPPR
jgi:peptidoglycan/LPS O-acetylase OafA/YrhL